MTSGTESAIHHWTVFIDGASRNNPGKAGAGIYVLRDGQEVAKQGFYLGIKTNNQAEYFAMLIGLFVVRMLRAEGDTVRIVSDSQLVVKQLQGEYRVRHPDLKPLYTYAQSLLKELNAHVAHVLRTENKEADRMANLGVDEELPVPPAFIMVLQDHGITI